MRSEEFLTEETTNLNSLYHGDYPDSDELFWDYVSKPELEMPLEVHTMPKHKVLIMLLSQYRAEHIDEIKELLDSQQRSIIKHYMKDPNLANQVIVVANDMIIDGNHRALAAAIKGVPIKYVDLSDLD